MLIHMELFGFPIFHFVVGSPDLGETEYVRNLELLTEEAEEETGFAFGFASSAEV